MYIYAGAHMCVCIILTHRQPSQKESKNHGSNSQTFSFCCFFLATHKQHPQQQEKHQQQQQQQQQEQKGKQFTLVSIQTTTNRITPQTTTAIPPHTHTNKRPKHSQTLAHSHSRTLRHAQTQTMSANKFAKKKETNKKTENKKRTQGDAMKTETENSSESKNKIPQHIATAFILLFLVLFVFSLFFLHICTR